jgi:hypothetical protein
MPPGYGDSCRCKLDGVNLILLSGINLLRLSTFVPIVNGDTLSMTVNTGISIINLIVAIL